MKYFIIRGLETNNEYLLFKLFKLDITDIEWSPEAPDGFIPWLIGRTDSRINQEQLARSVKHIWALTEMVRRGIQEAIIIEDDVLFHNEYGNLVMPSGYPFVRLGIGVNYDVKPGIEPVEPNNMVGSVAQYVTHEFAKRFLQSVCFEMTIDILYWSYIIDTKTPIVLVPVCHQISLLENVAPPTEYRRVLRSFPTLRKYNWFSLIHDFKNLRPIVEHFETQYGFSLKLANNILLDQYTNVDI